MHVVFIERKTLYVASRLAAFFAIVCSGLANSAAEDVVEFRIPTYTAPLAIPVAINGAEHLCMLDSGASICVFHTGLRDGLGKPLKKVPLTSADGKQVEIELFRSPEIRIGSICLRRSNRAFKSSDDGNILLRSLHKMRETPGVLFDTLTPDERVGCIDLSVFQEATGRDIEGIVGMPAFNENIVQIDFEQGRLRFLPLSSEPTSDWGELLDVDIDQNKMPRISLELADGTQERFIVDTGASETISLASDVYSNLVEKRAITNGLDTLAVTAGGRTQKRSGKISIVRIASFENRNLRVSDGGKKSRVGLAYLRHFRVTFDFGHNRMYVAKGAEFDKPDKEPVSGISLLRRSGKTIVVNVLHNSEGENAGIQQNDEVISVNEETVSDKPLDEVRWIFRERADANGQVSVRIRRDDIERDFRFTGYK